MSSAANFQSTINPANYGHHREILKPGYLRRGFLPVADPLCRFPRGSPYAVLDEVGLGLPQALLESSFRRQMRNFDIPFWVDSGSSNDPAALRLYYLRIGFIASAYIHQIGQQSCHSLPVNLAKPLIHVCERLDRPPILSYDGYALYNWKRLDPLQPVQLGNIETLQNFVELYDEHWFILVHVEIEAIAAEILAAITKIHYKSRATRNRDLCPEMWGIADAINKQTNVLKRIPEKMDPKLYFIKFRPYIGFFNKVHFQGIDAQPVDLRGETGAQSSIFPVLEALMKIPHEPSILMRHLDDLRNYMPSQHRQYIAEVRQLPSLRKKEYRNPFNAILDAMIGFRKVHYSWATEYIHNRSRDGLGTGGTPYRQWLAQLIDETCRHRF